MNNGEVVELGLPISFLEQLKIRILIKVKIKNQNASPLSMKLLPHNPSSQKTPGLTRDGGL